ncbi:MAG: GNAT family N-acetyltransferase [Pirellula sp.]|jgi:ribosomal protein S18 acetylase RimI-like enzyme|nr:GNAT family N-acetyltransferase [Pirellula sp.]
MNAFSEEPIRYAVELDLTTFEFIDCLKRSTLAERRPVDQPETIEKMLRQAQVIVTARNPSGVLVGVARSITDFAYCTYLSDLAVDEAYQRRGIGKQLIQQSHEASGLHTMLILLSAPKATTYYPHIGLQSHPSAWFIPRQ